MYDIVKGYVWRESGSKPIQIVGWPQIVKDPVLRAQVLGPDSTHNIKNSVFLRIVLSNFSKNNIQRVFQMINLRSYVIASNVTPSNVLRIITI